MRFQNAILLLSSLTAVSALHGRDTNSQLVYTDGNGAPVQNPQAYQMIGDSKNDYHRVGPLLLQDSHLVEQLAHFNRERIPERVVHAKGAGAYGTFVVTDDITDLTSAAFLSKVGKKSKVFIRFSTVGGEQGSADSARDPRGVAIKIYTEEGNEDWVFNNTPVFFIRDPTKFPLFIHTQKRDPQTHLKNATMFWDYLSTNQESIAQLMRLFSDRGTPYGFRNINAHSGHTYKFVKEDGSFVYVKIHMLTEQGEKWMNNEEATELAGSNPDFATQDLFEAIQKGEYPSWNVTVQVMTPEQAENFKYSVFDLTKTWPEDQFPHRRFGRLTLNKNPENYFAEVEQAAFSPSHQVPGIEVSADPVLQARVFSYPDTARYRLGVNYNTIPVNCPMRLHNPMQRDGAHAVYKNNYGSMPNYQSSFQPLKYKSTPSISHENWTGKAVLFASVPRDEDYEQANEQWLYLGTLPDQQQHFVHNVAVHLKAAHPKVREATYGMFARANSTMGELIRKETEKEVAAMK